MSETQSQTAADVATPSKSSLALAVVSTAIAEFDKVAAGLTELKSKFGGVVYEVATTKGMAEAKAARVAIRQPRYDVERIRKAAKAPILQLGRDLDSEAERITKEILAIEAPIDEQIKNEETRVENERQAKIAAEQKRVADIHARIAAIRGIADGASLKTSAEVKGLIDRLQQTVIDDSFCEFRVDAQKAFDVASESLTSIHASRVEFEAEQERVRLERIELERQRAEQAERDRVEQERQQAVAMLRSEIDGIRQQAVIAVVGRAGVRAGGTLQCARDTLEETKAWPIAEEHFGGLFDEASKAKTDAVAAIEFHIEKLEELEKQREHQARLDEEARERREAEERAHQEKLRQQQEEADRKAAAEQAERDREAEALRLQREENDRIAAEQQQQREAIAAEEARLAAERERIEQEKNAPANVESIAKPELEKVNHGLPSDYVESLNKLYPRRPSNHDIAVVVSNEFCVDVTTATQWLMEFAANEQDAAA